jgi:hypothetical protein
VNGVIVEVDHPTRCVDDIYDFRPKCSPTNWACRPFVQDRTPFDPELMSGTVGDRRQISVFAVEDVLQSCKPIQPPRRARTIMGVPERQWGRTNGPVHIIARISTPKLESHSLRSVRDQNRSGKDVGLETAAVR